MSKNCQLCWILLTSESAMEDEMCATCSIVIRCRVTAKLAPKAAQYCESCQKLKATAGSKICIYCEIIASQVRAKLKPVKTIDLDVETYQPVLGLVGVNMAHGGYTMRQVVQDDDF